MKNGEFIQKNEKLLEQALTRFFRPNIDEM